MASQTRACAINKCEISSCAVCHCCQNDLCLDHLKEHKDLLNIQLIPLANQINTFLDGLEHFDPISSSSFHVLEQWRIVAHETVDRFYEHMRHELFEQKKDQPLKKLHTIRDTLDRLIQKQGATRENIDSLTNDIRSIEQEINALQNIQINLRPLVIDDSLIISSTSINRTQQRTGNNELSQVASIGQNDLEAFQSRSAFQIFVQTPFKQEILVTVKSSDTILELKRKIQERLGISTDQQYLTWMGKPLIDDQFLATYDIQKLSTINLSYHLKK
ncbi:unnamed protein product [Rotaria sordida]|uniref:Ubiquitin-like domain-containing protein n=1 Tax=Rotaria sordida TaxID=392033 RepID=A0A815M8N2_9BILA|nr:unnamed protein product [Rotaria sordida]CAF1417178.1 unnamed protein product [Rotaria sordida]